MTGPVSSPDLDLAEYYRQLLGDKIECEIDLNVRVRGQLTYCGFEDCTPRVPDIGTSVDCTCEDDLTFPGIVTAIDLDKRFVYLAVAWREGT